MVQMANLFVRIVLSSCLELFLYFCICHGYCILKISSASFPVWWKSYCVSAEKSQLFGRILSFTPLSGATTHCFCLGGEHWEAESQLQHRSLPEHTENMDNALSTGSESLQNGSPSLQVRE